MGSTEADALALLMAGRMLLAEPEAWMQRASARNGLGLQCDPWHGSAERWCSYGALDAFFRECHSRATTHALRTLEGAMIPALNVIHFNDSQRHTAVMRAWDRAIERAGRESS